MILEPREVDRRAARLLVGREDLGHRHERLDQAAHRDLGQVLHRIAKMGQFPIDQRGDAVVLAEQEVARAGIAVKHNRRAAILRHVLRQPGERELQDRIGTGAEVEAPPLGHVRANPLRRRLARIAQRGERGMAGVDAVERGKLGDEIMRQCGLVACLRKAVVTRHESAEQR